MNAEDRLQELAEKLQKSLGFYFKDIKLLQEALVHRSYLNENPSSPLPSNERLEFLGDSVIGFIITGRLFQEFPQFSEGEMTQFRSQIICKESLSFLARQMDLGRYLLLSKGEDITGGRERDSNLSAAYEALVGAIYLDKGLQAARDFIFDKIKMHDISVFLKDETFDYKSKFQEYAQAVYQLTPAYHTVREEGPPHDRNFIVEVRIGGKTVGTGQGKSKKRATQNAARDALEKLTHRQ